MPTPIEGESNIPVDVQIEACYVQREAQVDGHDLDRMIALSGVAAQIEVPPAAGPRSLDSATHRAEPFPTAKTNGSASKQRPTPGPTTEFTKPTAEEIAVAVHHMQMRKRFTDSN